MEALRGGFTAERWMPILSPVLLVLAWEAIVQTGLLDARFIPAPSSVFVELVRVVSDGSLWPHVYVSMRRITFGFLLGAVPALILGVLMGLLPLLRKSVMPVVAALYPVPKSALLPLFLILFGLGEASKIATIASGVVFLVIINTVSGVLSVPAIYFDVGRSFGASRWQVVRTIAVPGSLPLMMTGIRLGAGMALILIVIAEFAGARAGLGYLIWNSWQMFQVELLFTGLFCIAVLGWGITTLFEALERRLTPWRF